MQFFGLLVLAGGLGHGAALFSTWSVATPLIERETRPVIISGLVADAEKRADNNRVILSDVTLPGVSRETTPARLRITIPTSHGAPAVGTHISVRAVVRPAGAPVVPDGFQFQ